MEVLAVIPVKKLDEAKSRLSSILSDDTREQFCLKMLEDVLRTVKSTEQINHVAVISRDPAVKETAKVFNASILEERQNGLNQAVSEAVQWGIERGVASVLILPSDIPLVEKIDLERMLTLRKRFSMVISPSQNRDGTNALLLTPPNAIPTFYGPLSFQRHFKEASKRGVRIFKFYSPRFALDIDTIEDIIDLIQQYPKEKSSYKLLKQAGVPEKLWTKVANRKTRP